MFTHSYRLNLSRVRANGNRMGEIVQKTLRFNKHTCFSRTYPGIMYSTGLVITKSNFTHCVCDFSLRVSCDFIFIF